MIIVDGKNKKMNHSNSNIRRKFGEKTKNEDKKKYEYEKSSTWIEI